MRVLIHNRAGVLERELDQYEIGSVDWAATDGGASLVIPKRAGDYTRAVGFWRPAAILNRPVVITFDNGMPDWCGIVHPHSDDGDSITLGVEYGTTALRRVCIETRFRLSGDPLTCLRSAMRRVAKDAYPVVLSPACERGGPEQRGTQQPTSLYRFLEALCERTGWEWTVVPQIDRDNRMAFAIVLRPRLGTWYGTSNALHGGVEVMTGPSQTAYGDRRANHVVALGKGDTLDKGPIAESPPEHDTKSVYARDQERNGRLTVVVQFPNIADRGRLQRAAQAELRRRFYPTITVAASITAAKRGRAAFELLRVGNVFELDIPEFDSRPARLMGWSFDPNTEQATLALRATASEPEYQPEEA